MFFYQNANPPIKLSKYNLLPKDQREEIINSLKRKKEWLVEIVSYCLMPSHFHLVLKQLLDDGVKDFLRLLTNSFSHYFNTKHDRTGSLFGGRFKAVHIENDEQLLHVVRYVHLNPYTSYVVKDLEHLEDYPYSSLSEYLGKSKNYLCQKRLVLNHFRTVEKYQSFVFNQGDYQRSLERIKYKILE